ncbi:MAG: hypothetical protein IMF06_09570 [Proteobacteria bacterium]|nr:hypothetical protein [Pseudomonadota bacterium]
MGGAERADNKISRRHFSRSLARATLGYGAVSALGLSSLYSLADSVISAAPKKPETETLVQYAFFLLPVLEPTHARYRAVADKISAQAAQVPPIASLMADGISALDASDKGPWLELPAQERADIVRGLEATPFFGFLRWTAAEIVMRAPGLWETLGYQGSAIEHGGYLHRGFDDIDWLPKTTPES